MIRAILASDLWQRQLPTVTQDTPKASLQVELSQLQCVRRVTAGHVVAHADNIATCVRDQYSSSTDLTRRKRAG